MEESEHEWKNECRGRLGGGHGAAVVDVFKMKNEKACDRETTKREKGRKEERT